jgi:hypothetical protein
MIRILSIAVSTIVFIFGTILQNAVQILFEADETGAMFFTLLRRYHPSILLLTIFTGNFLPGIVTGLISTTGSSLRERIWFAIVAAIVSLSILDTIIFFFAPPVSLQAGRFQLSTYAELRTYYFSLLSNLVGAPVAGIIVGSATHFFAVRFSKPTESKE